MSKDEKFQFYKHDFLIPFGFWQGVGSAENYEKNGIVIKALGGKKIYPLHGVWAPTSQKYLNLLEELLEEKKNLLKNPKNVLDLGCGTGILGFLSISKLGAKKVFGVDSNPNAVRCAKMNSEVLGAAESFSAEIFDLSKGEDMAQTLSERGFLKIAIIFLFFFVKNDIIFFSQLSKKI